MRFKPEEQINFNAKIRYLNDKLCKKNYAVIHEFCLKLYINLKKRQK